MKNMNLHLRQGKKLQQLYVICKRTYSSEKINIVDKILKIEEEKKNKHTKKYYPK